MEPEQPTEGPPIEVLGGDHYYHNLPVTEVLQNQQQPLRSQEQFQQTQEQHQRELLRRLPDPPQQQNQIQGDQIQQVQQTQEQSPHRSLAKELQEKLSNNAKEVVEQFVLPIDIERTIKRVNLQICKVKQHADADWKTEASSLEWRMCMERKHAQRVYGTTDKRISIRELFKTAKEIAENEANWKCKDEISKKAFINKHGNTVSLIGLPGIGKTTLTQMVTQSILDELILPGTQYLFYILIKNVNFKKKVLVSQFLIENSLPGQAYSNKQYKAITQELQNNPNVVIVMDGLDEAGVPFSTTTHCCQLDTKEKPVDIIKNLFNATLLSNAIKVVTSRPGQFYQIHQDYRPTIVLEVLGLDKVEQKELIKMLCGVEKYPGIKELLKQKANLSALCYVPVNCIYIIDSLLSGVGDIHSMTQVLISTLTKYISSGHLKDMEQADLRSELIKLTELAFRGFEKKKVVFDKNDFVEVGLPDLVVKNFLHTYVEQSAGIKMRIMDGKKRSYFAHLTLQEFFCAIYVMLFMPYESLSKYGSMFKDVQWDVVVRFMFGLCNSSSYMEMRDIFLDSMIRDFERKKKMLLEIVSCQNLWDNDTLIKVSGWVNESNDEEISTTFHKSLPSDVELKLSNDPSKAHDVAFALKSCLASHNLRVALTTEALIFLRGLKNLTNLKIHHLKLDDLDMTELTAYLVRRMNDFDKLELKDCKHLSASMMELGPAINQRLNKFELNINSYLDEDGAKILGDCVQNISKLRINEQKISVQSRIILREAVQQLPNPSDLVVVDGGQYENGQEGAQWMKTWKVYEFDTVDDLNRIHQLEPGKITKLWLRACDMTGWYKELEMSDIAGYLQPHMEALDELRLDGCGQLIVGLSQAINERQNKMVLHINNFYLYDDGVKALCHCLCNISKLGIDERWISVQNRIILREAVQQLPNPQDLVVDDGGEDTDTKYDDDDERYFRWGEQDAVQWVKTWTVFKDDKVDDLKRIIQLEPGKITRLWLKATTTSDWYTELEMSEIAVYLQPHMLALDELRLYECEELFEFLSIYIKIRQNKMVLHIIQFYCYGDGIDDLCYCLPNISKLRIEESRISVQNRIILREAVQQLPNPEDLVVDAGGRLIMGELGWGEQNGAQWLKTWTVYNDDKADDLERILQLEPGKITRLFLRAIGIPEWYRNLEKSDIAGYLQPHIKALDELWLYNCERMIVGLSKAINERQNKMKLGLIDHNWFSDNRLPDDIVKCLSSCLGKISELDLGSYRLSSNSHLTMQDAIKQIPSPQDFILKGERISDLMDWFHKFKRRKLKRRHS